MLNHCKFVEKEMLFVMNIVENLFAETKKHHFDVEVEMYLRYLIVHNQSVVFDKLKMFELYIFKK